MEVPFYQVLHWNEKVIDKEGVPRRKIKICVRRVLVDGKARETDRNRVFGPNGAVLFVGVASDPLDRQGLTTHGLDEIANPKFLNAYLAVWGSDACAFHKTTDSITLVTAIRPGNCRHGERRCN